VSEGEQTIRHAPSGPSLSRFPGHWSPRHLSTGARPIPSRRDCRCRPERTPHAESGAQHRPGPRKVSRSPPLIVHAHRCRHFYPRGGFKEVSIAALGLYDEGEYSLAWCVTHTRSHCHGVAPGATSLHASSTAWMVRAVGDRYRLSGPARPIACRRRQTPPDPRNPARRAPACRRRSPGPRAADRPAPVVSPHLRWATVADSAFSNSGALVSTHSKQRLVPLLETTGSGKLGTPFLRNAGRERDERLPVGASRYRCARRRGNARGALAGYARPAEPLGTPRGEHDEGQLRRGDEARRRRNRRSPPSSDFA
jgi:hypothetical protein